MSRFSVATPASLSATIPHPFFFNRPRSVSGEAAGLKREELAIHIQAGGVFPIGARFQVMVFGGPSFFQVTQGVVTDLTYSDSYPYDTASFRSAVTTSEKQNKIGFNAGGDVAFFFTRQIGVGFTAKFAGSNIDLPSAGGGTTPVKAGGMQAGGGLRLRF